MLPLTSVSFWTLKTKTPSGLVDKTAATPSVKSDSRGERKRSWDMFSRRTVMLFVNMSSVMMVTRRVQRAETWWSPSEKTQRYIERLETSCLNWIEWHSSGWQVVSLHSCEWDELWEHAGTWSLILWLFTKHFDLHSVMILFSHCLNSNTTSFLSSNSSTVNTKIQFWERFGVEGCWISVVIFFYQKNINLLFIYLFDFKNIFFIYLIL